MILDHGCPESVYYHRRLWAIHQLARTDDAFYGGVTMGVQPLDAPDDFPAGSTFDAFNGIVMTDETWPVSQLVPREPPDDYFDE